MRCFLTLITTILPLLVVVGSTEDTADDKDNARLADDPRPSQPITAHDYGGSRVGLRPSSGASAGFQPSMFAGGNQQGGSNPWSIPYEAFTGSGGGMYGGMGYGGGNSMGYNNYGGMGYGNGYGGGGGGNYGGYNGMGQYGMPNMMGSYGGAGFSDYDYGYPQMSAGYGGYGGYGPLSSSSGGGGGFNGYGAGIYGGMPTPFGSGSPMTSFGGGSPMTSFGGGGYGAGFGSYGAIGPRGGSGGENPYSTRFIPPNPPPPKRQSFVVPTDVTGGNYEKLPGTQPSQTNYGYSYAGYIERQAKMYPIMMYTLVACVPCQTAKHVLAVSYVDVRSHFLELSGDEEWQRQLQVDLQHITGQYTFPYIFICGNFVGGASDLMQLHQSGQLRSMVASCSSKSATKALS